MIPLMPTARLPRIRPLRKASSHGFGIHSKPPARVASLYGVEDRKKESMVEEAKAPLVVLRDAVVRREGREILHVDDFTLDQGENIALIGPNGAGKSTFIHLITREVFPLWREHPRRFQGAGTGYARRDQEMPRSRFLDDAEPDRGPSIRPRSGVRRYLRLSGDTSASCHERGGKAQGEEALAFSGWRASPIVMS